MHKQEEWRMGSFEHRAANAANATEAARTGLSSKHSDSNAHQFVKGQLANQLIQHEWLTDIPEDFYNDWWSYLILT